MLHSISALRTTAHTRTMAKRRKTGKKPAAATAAAPAAAQPPAPQGLDAWEGDSDASDNDLEADEFAAAEGEGEAVSQAHCSTVPVLVV